MLPRGIFRRRRGLCRGPFIGHSSKPLPRARTALGKEKKPSRAGVVGGFFAEGRPSAKKWFFLIFFAEGRLSAKIFFNLCRGPPPWPSAKKFSGFFPKKSLPRAIARALGKGFFFKKFFAEGRPSAKKCFF